MLGLPLESSTGPDRTRSELEFLFLDLCRKHRLPVPEVNIWIGALLVDFVWRDRKLIVETDGYRYHRGRVAFEDDRTRDLKLRALGYDVIRLTHRQVVSGSEEVLAALKKALVADALTGIPGIGVSLYPARKGPDRARSGSRSDVSGST